MRGQAETLGEYFAEQLEKVGFATTVEYRTGAEASPIWLMGDPWEGQWHVSVAGVLLLSIVTKGTSSTRCTLADHDNRSSSSRTHS